jgi:hypothetical protein
MKSKDQLKTKVLDLVEELKDKGRFVKNVRLDDNRENAPLKVIVKRNF